MDGFEWLLAEATFHMTAHGENVASAHRVVSGNISMFDWGRD